MIDIQQKEEKDNLASYFTMQFEADQVSQQLVLENTQLNELENILLNDINLDELLFDLNNHQTLPSSSSSSSSNMIENDDSQNLNLINFSLFDQLLLPPIDETTMESNLDSNYSPVSFSISTNDEATMSSVDFKISELNKNKKVKRLNDKTSSTSYIEVNSNKLAAQKYRNKKIQKREQLFADCEHYEKLNKDLRKKIDDIQTEVNLIKTLLVQVYLAKK
jgi:hypothetical protein